VYICENVAHLSPSSPNPAQRQIRKMAKFGSTSFTWVVLLIVRLRSGISRLFMFCTLCRQIPLGLPNFWHSLWSLTARSNSLSHWSICFRMLLPYNEFHFHGLNFYENTCLEVWDHYLITFSCIGCRYVKLDLCEHSPSTQKLADLPDMRGRHSTYTQLHCKFPLESHSHIYVEYFDVCVDQ